MHLGPDKNENRVARILNWGIQHFLVVLNTEKDREWLSGTIYVWLFFLFLIST